MHVGETWNESIEMRDSATGRPRRRLTSAGIYNTTPTYHYNSAFTADSRYLVFATAREGRSAIMRAEVATGDLTVLAASSGFGDYKRMEQCLPWAPGEHGLGGFTGGNLALVPRSGVAVAVVPDRILAIEVETGTTRVLCDEVPLAVGYRVPGGNASGDKVYIPRRPSHPDLIAGRERPRQAYKQAVHAERGGIPVELEEFDLTSGARRIVYQEDVAGSNHVLPSPTDDDLLLLDRDLPPTYEYYGDHCVTPRAHLLRLSTGALTPLRPRNRHQFQSHSNWSPDGERVYYHGPAYEGHEQPVREGARLGEMFVGASALDGRSVFEMNLPDYHYGHVSTHPQQDCIVTDGILSADLVCAIHYRDLDSAGSPRIEVLARHDTAWDGMLGQCRDPHVHISPDGRWLSCNVAAAGRSDIHLIRIA